ncbi:MAG: AAA family ATPase [Deltaproteobacteria bacterium]|nr:AAA family ATPase [Deltaproteobacteria bacterium]
MKLDKNEFIAGRPLSPGEDLMTGEWTLQEILSAVAQGNNVSVVGVRRMGKTTLNNFLRDEKERGKFDFGEDRSWICVDLQKDINMGPQRFVNILKEQGLDLTINDPKDESEVFMALSRAADSQPIVLAIDEFDAAMTTELFTAKGLNALRAAYNNKDLTLICFSFRTISRICDLRLRQTGQDESELLSSFFNTFKVVNIPPVPEEDFSAWLSRKNVPECWHEPIFREAGPCPFLLQLLCDAIYWTYDGVFTDRGPIQISPEALDKFMATAASHYDRAIQPLNKRAKEILIHYARLGVDHDGTIRCDGTASYGGNPLEDEPICESLANKRLLLKSWDGGKKEYKIFSNQLAKRLLMGRTA